jgi:hypothetical protein
MFGLSRHLYFEQWFLQDRIMLRHCLAAEGSFTRESDFALSLQVY